MLESDIELPEDDHNLGPTSQLQGRWETVDKIRGKAVYKRACVYKWIYRRFERKTGGRWRAAEEAHRNKLADWQTWKVCICFTYDQIRILKSEGCFWPDSTSCFCSTIFQVFLEKYFVEILEEVVSLRSTGRNIRFYHEGCEVSNELFPHRQREAIQERRLVDSPITSLKPSNFEILQSFPRFVSPSKVILLATFSEFEVKDCQNFADLLKRVVMYHKIKN